MGVEWNFGFGTYSICYAFYWRQVIAIIPSAQFNHLHGSLLRTFGLAKGLANRNP